EPSSLRGTTSAHHRRLIRRIPGRPRLGYGAAGRRIRRGQLRGDALVQTALKLGLRGLALVLLKPGRKYPLGVDVVRDAVAALVLKLIRNRRALLRIVGREIAVRPARLP